VSNFDIAVVHILKNEGGYVNDPHDPGGETNFGISKRVYPNLNIASLTADDAKAIYRRDYWDRIRGDDLPKHLALPVFDMAVNAGVGSAIKALQRSLKVEDDGVLGPVTLAKAQASTIAVGVAYARRRIRYYASLPGWERYGDSWTQRTLETLIESVT
jgi:lysozyme family protein